MSKKQLQRTGQNLWYQAKCFYKSHDLAIRIQFILLIIPLLLTLFSFYLGGVTFIDYLSYAFAILWICYYAYFWKNGELYFNWWDDFLCLYKEVEAHYIGNLWNDDKFLKKIASKEKKMNTCSRKPKIHPIAKFWANKTIWEEMRYDNEKMVWWKQ